MMKPIKPVSPFRKWLQSDHIVAVACVLAMPCAILLA